MDEAMAKRGCVPADGAEIKISQPALNYVVLN